MLTDTKIDYLGNDAALETLAIMYSLPYALLMYAYVVVPLALGDALSQVSQVDMFYLGLWTGLV